LQLLPPVTGTEMQAGEVPAGLKKLTTRTSTNPRSATLDQLLAAREKELGEMAGVAGTDLGGRRAEGGVH
jgi:hypothetical protein